MQIGIPRALFYYHYYPLWRAFFDALDVTCVVSPPTHKGIVAQGAARVTGDNCLPLKVYLGHVLSLVGRVDYLFVPLIRTLMSDEENCARLRGLPDLVRSLVPESPPLLAPEIDLQSGERQATAVALVRGRPYPRHWRISRRMAARASISRYRLKRGRPLYPR